MRDQQQSLLEVGQVVLQPDRSFQIQMVSGLIEHKQIGGDEKRTCQRNSHSPTTRKLLGGHALVKSAKAHTLRSTFILGVNCKPLKMADALSTAVAALMSINLSSTSANLSAIWIPSSSSSVSFSNYHVSCRSNLAFTLSLSSSCSLRRAIRSVSAATTASRAMVSLPSISCST